jgi:S1-C subfamily serine protease
MMPGPSFSDDLIVQSVVKIITMQSHPDYNTPWAISLANQVSGSGCLVANNHILTNAHIVSNASYITVQVHGQTKKYKAKVVAVSHDADLALLSVYDPSFFKDLVPLEIGPLPKPSDKVIVYGYPEGGDSLSTTSGVISRIEHVKYPHSLISLLGIQIDAAVNPGNSGGPAIVKNKITGIVMSKKSDSENISYLVPSSIVKHFLADISDGYLNFARKRQ